MKNTTPKEATQILNAGGVIIFPTETLYGLGCDATNPQALLKVYQIKQREFGKTFPILVKNLTMLSDYAILNAEQKNMIAKTKTPTNFVLKTKNLSPLATQNRTGAFRISSCPWVKSLFRHFDRPIVATSANISRRPPLTDPLKYKEMFGKAAEMIDAVIAAGINRRTKSSRIIDLTKKPYTTLRA